MPKKAKNPKKLGRPEAIDCEELLKRYRALKQFFEHNWGRIGLEFQRVRKPDDVRVVLKMVPGVEWCTPFRQEASLGCILMDGGSAVDARELAGTREQYEGADATEHRLSLEYYPLRQKADEATIALKVFISQLSLGIRFFPFFFVVAVAGEKLGIRDLTIRSSRLEAKFQQAQKKTRDLREKLLSQSAWYTRNEVVRFARSRRHVGTPTTFAKAIALARRPQIWRRRFKWLRDSRPGERRSFASARWNRRRAPHHPPAACKSRSEEAGHDWERGLYYS